MLITLAKSINIWVKIDQEVEIKNRPKPVEKFSTSFDQFFVQTSWPFFTNIPIDLAKVVNMKVVYNASSFPKCPRAQIYHA